MLTPKILHDTEVAIAVINRGFHDGAFAVIIPCGNLNVSRGIGHGAGQEFP